MSKKFTTEPVIGHHVSIERYEGESKLSKQLDELAKHLDAPRRNRERVRITVGDVDWDETREVTMTIGVFEAIIEWYEESR